MVRSPTLKQLQTELRGRGLPTSGSKGVLQERLAADNRQQQQEGAALPPNAAQVATEAPASLRKP